jgi:ribonuclease D
MGDKTLLAMAECVPESSAQLERLPGMTPRQMRRYGRSILTAVQRGREEPPPQPPTPEPVSESFLARHEALRTWRKHTAERRGVESDVILPREVMLDIARLAPTSLEELHQIMGPLHWRFRTYGDGILRALRR